FPENGPAEELIVFSSSHTTVRHACLSGQASPALGVWVLFVPAFVYGKSKALHVLNVRAQATRGFEAANLGCFQLHDCRCVPVPRDCESRSPVGVLYPFLFVVMDNKKQNAAAEAQAAAAKKNRSIDSFRQGDVWCNIFAFDNKNA